MYDAIPKVKAPERYEDRMFHRSDLVEIISNDRFEVKMQYPILGMRNAVKQCFLREEVYDKLQEAAKLLPQGYKFRILDAWRPFDLQRELYERYSKDIIKKFQLDRCTSERRKQVIREFVSEPEENRNVPPVHTTGGAVDLTILDASGRELAMGTGFDDFTKLAYTAAFEDKKNQTVRTNRRMLYYIMTEVGFTNLPSEWWHFDYGDRFWAYYTQEPAIYEGIFTREEINEKNR